MNLTSKLPHLAALQPKFELKTSRVWQRYGLKFVLLVRSDICFVSTSRVWQRYGLNFVFVS